MAHIHLRRVMIQHIRFDLLDQPSRFLLRDIDLVQGCLAIDIGLLAGGDVVEDMHLVALFEVGINRMGRDKARAARHDNFHAALFLSWTRK
jgi:hypothetical protein